MDSPEDIIAKTPRSQAPSVEFPGTLSQRQLEYIVSLVAEREMSEESRAEALRRAPSLSRADASRWIERLLTLPRRQAGNGWSVNYREVKRAKRNGEEEVRVIGFLKRGDTVVPRGSYGIVHEQLTEAGNDISFYEIWVGDRDSRWDGAWTVKHVVGPNRTKVPRPQARAILDKIAEDPAGAAAVYGHNIGRCGICGIQLTNKTSRERGIGPVCAQNWGW